jgi:hypothetical protein
MCSSAMIHARTLSSDFEPGRSVGCCGCVSQIRRSSSAVSSKLGIWRPRLSMLRNSSRMVWQQRHRLSAVNLPARKWKTETELSSSQIPGRHRACQKWYGILHVLRQVPRHPCGLKHRDSSVGDVGQQRRSRSKQL